MELNIFSAILPSGQGNLFKGIDNYLVVGSIWGSRVLESFGQQLYLHQILIHKDIQKNQ